LPLDQAVDLGMASVLEGELMTKIDFLKLYKSMTKEKVEIFEVKNADYSDREGRNVLVQFDRLAASLGTTPEMALRSSWRSTLTRSGPIVGMVT
jgi:hypothetical protein